MKLLEHAVIAGMLVRNRILRSATWEALADAQGYMSEKQYRIYDQLAKNEVGLICTGYARVDGEDRPNAGMMAFMTMLHPAVSGVNPARPCLWGEDHDADRLWRDQDDL